MGKFDEVSKSSEIRSLNLRGKGQMGVRTECWRVFYECFVFFGAASAGEACWVLFRFLYWGQLADPCLIIHIDDVGWSVVSERFVQALIVPPVHPVQRGELNLCQ